MRHGWALSEPRLTRCERDYLGVCCAIRQDRDHALYQYNNSTRYVRAVNDYAAVLAADPAAFSGYYRWDVYYNTTAGDVLLPIGYVASAPIPVADYLATHPQ